MAESTKKRRRKPGEPKKKGGWNESKKFRMQLKALSAHMTKQEAYWKARADATCRVYTPEEVEEYAKARGLVAATTVDKGGAK